MRESLVDVGDPGALGLAQRHRARAARGALDLGFDRLRRSLFHLGRLFGRRLGFGHAKHVAAFLGLSFQALGFLCRPPRVFGQSGFFRFLSPALFIREGHQFGFHRTGDLAKRVQQRLECNVNGFPIVVMRLFLQLALGLCVLLDLLDLRQEVVGFLCLFLGLDLGQLDPRRACVGDLARPQFERLDRRRIIGQIAAAVVAHGGGCVFVQQLDLLFRVGWGRLRQDRQQHAWLP